MSQLSPELTKLIRVIPSGKRLIGLPMNVEYKALAAEGQTAHGLSPVVVILDELGQVPGSQDPFVEALETAQGAYDDGSQLVLSTQAPTERSEERSVGIESVSPCRSGWSLHHKK